jgi:hypothetical protein
MAEQRIEPLNDAEQRWITAELGNARALVDSVSPDDAGSALSPIVLDRAFKAARLSAGVDANAANAIINAIGMAFGQYLVDQLGFSWVAVFDKDGSEIAVVALPGQADMLVFPPNLVAKRWASGTTDFLDYVYEGIRKDVKNFEADWAADPRNDRPLPRTGPAVKRSWLRRLFGRGLGR